MISSMIRAVAVLLYLDVVAAATIPILAPPSNAVWQPVSNFNAAQNITFNHTPSTITTPNTYDPPDEGYTIHAYQTPISVVFSQYRPLIPGPALFLTYHYAGVEALSKGTLQITESQSWKWEAVLLLWPRAGMTWDMFATVILVFDEFARTMGLWGFRYDIYYQGKGAVGHGIVFGKMLGVGGAASS